VATINGTGWDAASAQEALSTVLKKGIQQRMMLIQRTDNELAELARIYEAL